MVDGGGVGRICLAMVTATFPPARGRALTGGTAPIRSSAEVSRMFLAALLLLGVPFL